MTRISSENRKTRETTVDVALSLDGGSEPQISTGIPFFDHMLTLFAVHGFFDLKIEAKGDIEVDFHHTVEDVGIVLGNAFNTALGDRKGINRFGFAVTPMDDALAQVALDLSKRPFLVYNLPILTGSSGSFGVSLAKEFFRAFSVSAGMNLHIHVPYGENEHHVIEAVFKSLGRAMDQACIVEPRVKQIRSSKGLL
ncbi:MAG: imidazoleglycerol-phosphate dehydratase HisB [Proteobacteria bacterium]|nr:imidazoleglycerol-phosphate dehydratase HisB [Pseudomonadota bacterium]